MAESWRSFWKGWGAAAALWPVVVLLYVVDALMALILAIPPVDHLAQLFGRSAMAPDLLGPVTLNLLIEATEGWESVPVPWPLYLLMPFLSLLATTFLRGGTLAALAKGSQPFRWTDFFSDCARFFVRLLLLLPFLLPGLLAAVSLFALGNLLLGLIPTPGPVAPAMAGLRLGLLPFLMLLLLATVDYARISLVLEPERSVPRHAHLALRFLIWRFPRVALLALAFGLAGALIVATYPVLLRSSPLFAGFLPALVVQQLVVLLAAWHRVATLGGEMELFRGSGS